MTKNVWVSVEGLHNNGEGEEKVEVIAPGKYYRKNGYSYLLYDEISEESCSTARNTIKYNDSMFSITKRGSINSDMVFEAGKRNITNYATPYGSFLVGVNADRVNVNERENEISIDIDYTLDVDYEHLADCRIRMKIRPNSEGALSDGDKGQS